VELGLEPGPELELELELELDPEPRDVRRPEDERSSSLSVSPPLEESP
jgi:hypothetical protein